MKATIKLELEEYEKKVISYKQLPLSENKDLQWFSEQFSPLITITPDINNQCVLQAGSRVGVIESGDLRVQVCPRLSADEFCTLLRYVLSGHVPPEHYRSSSNITWGIGFEDALCMILCDEITEILRIGLSRRYEECQESLRLLRGRPVWERNFPWFGAKSREIICRYQQLTYDNLDNRILLAGLKCAAMLSQHKDVKAPILQHLKTFRELASETVVEPYHFVNAQNSYNRLNEHYYIVHNLCKMLAFGLRHESIFDAGQEIVSGIVLDMADMFEQFVEKIMEDLLVVRGFSIHSQTTDNKALIDDDGKTYSSIRPDLEMWKDGKICGVMDAKYKQYWRANSVDYRPVQKISNEDLYQLFFYQQRMQRKHSLLFPLPAFIISPLPEEDERKDSPCISKRFRRIQWRAGSEKDGDVQLILLPMTRCLRLLQEGRSICDAIADSGIDSIMSNVFYNQMEGNLHS
jgi:5-methylcytosine-specific restriction enzyme subunit McrC